MRTVLIICLALILASTFLGCGGKSTTAAAATADEQLLGTWRPIFAKEGATWVPPATALGWGANWATQTLQFRPSGFGEKRAYDASGALRQTDYGTWKALNGSGSLTYGTVTTNFTYRIIADNNVPWMIELTFTRGGHTYLTRWAKDVPLTAQNPTLVATWIVRTSTSPSPVFVNGARVSAATFFGLVAGSDGMSVQFLADGTVIRRELKADMVIKRDTGTWASGGSTFTMTLPDTNIRGYFDTAGSGATTFVDSSSPNTVTINWSAWGNVGVHPANLQGKWRIAGVTEDGNPIQPGSFFGWEPGVDSMVVEFWADGTAESRNYTGAALTSSDLGSWQTLGTTLQLTFMDLQSMMYNINGAVAAMTLTQNGKTYVLTFNQEP